MTEIYSLLDPKVLEKSPVVRRLMGEFEAMLPRHFAKAYFVPAASERGFDHVLRANCGNQNCSFRATVHLIRMVVGFCELKKNG
jgi:hypothetical protein